IDSDGDVRLQSFPSRKDIARPKKRCKSLHARITVAMQCVHALIRPVHLRTFEIHAIARQARGRVETVTLIGPPAIHLLVEERFVYRPITAHLAIWRPMTVRGSSTRKRRRSARICHPAR